MTALKETLLNLRGERLFSAPNFAVQLREFKAAAENVVGMFDALPSSRPPQDTIENVIRGAVAYGVDALPMRDMRLLMCGLWLKVDGGVVAENRPLLAQVLTKMESLNKRAHFKALARSYLEEFTPNMAGIAEVSAILQKLAPAEWLERHRRWGIFGPNAPELIAEFLGNAGTNRESVAAAVKAVGLKGALSTGMLPAAFRVALLKYGRDPSAASLPRLIAWHNFAAGSGGFCGKEYAEGLLLPWRGENPHEDVKIQTRDALLDALGDPRMQGGRSNWFAVDASARAVILRWLVEVALAQFFRVIDKVSREGEGEHMWKRRRRFWGAYYRHNVLREAWVAFGLVGQGHLRGSGKDVSYAEIEGAQRNHAVLLMKIGDLTVADWNVNGKCHIWRKDSKHAPRLYRRHYTAYELGKGNFGADASFVHGASGNWRRDVAEYIRNWTGIAVPMSEYMR